MLVEFDMRNNLSIAALDVAYWRRTPLNGFMTNQFDLTDDQLAIQYLR